LMVRHQIIMRILIGFSTKGFLN
ncbi:uncharacterized protein METZ01_LOCUS160025, partial [marine metagenome]